MSKITKALRNYALLAILAVMASLCMTLAGGQPVQAQAPPTANGAICKEGSGTIENPCVNPDYNQIKPNAKKSDPSQLSCGGSDCGGIIADIVNPAIRIMTGLVGLIVAISLVAAAITYGSAGGDPSKVAAAKKRITNSIIALIAYIFTAGLLQWLIPGGLV
jgi:hypothetical protein